MARSRPARQRFGTWIVISVLLAAALIGTLWVPFYNHLTPALGGFPLFYWYQLMWVPIVAILAAAAYLLSRLAQRGSAANAQSRTRDRGRRASRSPAAGPGGACPPRPACA
jgi:Protein of unknown function (DUF3311)